MISKTERIALNVKGRVVSVVEKTEIQVGRRRGEEGRGVGIVCTLQYEYTVFTRMIGYAAMRAVSLFR